MEIYLPLVGDFSLPVAVRNEEFEDGDLGLSNPTPFAAPGS